MQDGYKPVPELPPSYSPPASPARAGAPGPELSSSSLPPHPEPTPSDNVTSTPAAVAIPSLQRYQRTVGSIYGYFSNSSSRQARLKEMHVILDTDDVQPAIGDEGGPKFQEFLANIAEKNGEMYFKGEKIKATRAMRQAVDGELVHANYSKNSFQELVKIMATQHAGFLPETTKLLAAISVIPMRTVPCGHGFSIQNRIKTKGRARIKAENLDVLMRICIEGPPIEQFDFYRALEKFRVEKHRRIFQGPCKERCPCRQRFYT
ncbi:hypothetical protein JOQ06_018736, partial [Pogonophryne albipinna]